MSLIRVLIVDDHYLVRIAVKQIIDTEPGLSVVGEAASVEEAVASCAALRPDVTLMDLRLPDGSGVDAIAAITRADRHARVMILSTFDAAEDVRRALAAGARGYVLKNVRHQEFVDAIRRVHAGEIVVPPDVASRVVIGMSADPLSARELDILTLITQGRRNKEIAHLLGIAEATVKAHVRHIFEKLGVQDRTKAVSVALQRGLVKLPS